MIDYARAMAVALFVTCLVDTLVPEVGRATVTLLERLGVEVEFPRAQTCCGQLHLNAGYPEPAAALARRFVETFAGYEAIVAPSGSCVAHVRSHVPELAPDPEGVAGRTLELSEFLVDRLGAGDVGSTYEGRAHLPPDVSLAAGAPARRPTRVAAARRGRASSSGRSATRASAAASAARSRCERRRLDGDAGRQAAARRGDRRRRRLRVRRVVPPAHLRGGLERRGSPVRAVHLAEVLGDVSAAAARGAPRLPFERSAPEALEDAATRANVLRATATIRRRRAAVVAETPDWEELRAAGEAIRERALLRLDELLARLEAAVAAAGGQVHWARDAAEANAVVVD